MAFSVSIVSGRWNQVLVSGRWQTERLEGGGGRGGEKVHLLTHAPLGGRVGKNGQLNVAGHANVMADQFIRWTVASKLQCTHCGFAATKPSHFRRHLLSKHLEDFFLLWPVRLCSWEEKHVKNTGNKLTQRPAISLWPLHSGLTDI